MSEITNEIKKRRTFAIILIPMRERQRLTENSIIWRVINQDRFCQGKSDIQHAVSDWMEIEKERGIIPENIATIILFATRETRLFTEENNSGPENRKKQ